MEESASRIAIGLAVILTASACVDQAHPTDLDLTPQFSRVSACYGVSGTIVEAFAGADFPNNIFYFAGPVAGDLVGASFAALTGSDNPAGDPPSPLLFGAGTRTITVTGGSVAALEGAILAFALEQTSFQRGAVVRSSDRMTLVSGARRGHLTTHGRFDFGTFSLSATYHGSICP